MKKSLKLVLAISNALFLVLTLFVNSLSAILPLNGKTPGQLSDQYPNLFVPAGLTFSIWGIIYLLLLAFVVYQFISLLKKDSVVEKIGPWFILSCLANSGWIFAWHYELMGLSIAAMLLLLASLIVIYAKVGITGKDASLLRKVFTFIPFSVYLGWISVATIANITAGFVKWGWNGWGLIPEVWFVIVIAVALLLGLIYLFKNSDIFYALVLDWALYGILVKRMAQADAPGLIILIPLIGAMALISIGILTQIIRGRVYNKA